MFKNRPLLAHCPITENEKKTWPTLINLSQIYLLAVKNALIVPMSPCPHVPITLLPKTRIHEIILQKKALSKWKRKFEKKWPTWFAPSYSIMKITLT